MNVLLEPDTRLPIWRRSEGFFPVATQGTVSENPTGPEKLQYKNKDLYNSWQDAFRPETQCIINLSIVLSIFNSLSFNLSKKILEARKSTENTLLPT